MIFSKVPVNVYMYRLYKHILFKGAYGVNDRNVYTSSLSLLLLM